MIVYFLFADLPQTICRMMSLYSSEDECEFNMQVETDEQDQVIIILNVEGCIFEAAFRALPDVLGSTAKVEIYDPSVEYSSRQLVNQVEAEPLLYAFYQFISWLRHKNRLVESTNYLYKFDRLRIDAVFPENERPNSANYTCQIFVPETASGFISWWQEERTAHPGYSMDGGIKDRFFPNMLFDKRDLNSYQLILEGHVIDTIRARIEILNGQGGNTPPNGSGHFALGTMLGLKDGLQLRFWSFTTVGIGRIFMLELYEKIKVRWPDARIEKGDWLDRRAYKPEQSGDIVVRWVDEVEDERKVDDSWREEPTTKNPEDWFLHRLWKEQNGERPKPQKYMGEKCAYSEKHFGREYRKWKKRHFGE